VVGMIVRHQQIMDIIDGQSIFTKALLERACAHAGIYHQSIFIIEKAVTVATTATPKGNKSQHFIRYFAQKYEKEAIIPKFFFTFVQI
jgi:hypothetical protein